MGSCVKLLVGLRKQPSLQAPRRESSLAARREKKDGCFRRLVVRQYKILRLRGHGSRDVLQGQFITYAINIRLYSCAACNEISS